MTCVAFSANHGLEGGQDQAVMSAASLPPNLLQPTQTQILAPAGLEVSSNITWRWFVGRFVLV